MSSQVVIFDNSMFFSAARGVVKHDEHSNGDLVAYKQKPLELFRGHVLECLTLVVCSQDAQITGHDVLIFECIRWSFRNPETWRCFFLPAGTRFGGTDVRVDMKGLTEEWSFTLPSGWAASKLSVLDNRFERVKLQCCIGGI